MKKSLLSLIALVAIFFSERAYAQCTATIVSNYTNICTNDTLLLQATPLGMPNYQWEVNGVPVGTNSWDYTQIMNTPGTHVFTATVTDNNSCVATSNAITVVVANAPNNVVVSNNGPICAGNTLQLNATGNNITTYQWYGPGGFSSTAQNPSIPNATSTNSGYYYLYASNGSCTIAAGTQAVVNGLTPALTAGGNGGCVGTTVSLWANVSGITNYTLNWTGPNGFNDTASMINIPNATQALSGTYTVTVTGNGCSGPVTFTQTVTISVDPAPTVTASNNGPICVFSTLQLTGTVSGATSVLWNGPGGYTSTSLSPSIPNANTSNSGLYILNAYNGGCTVNASTTATVMNSSAVVGAYSMFPNVCEGDSIVLYGSSAGFTSVAYSWTGPNGFSSTQQNTFILPSQLASSGTYTLTATGNACGGPVTLSDMVNVNVVPCDSVWPGDANSDFMVVYSDILELGVLYGQTGPVRTGASINWVAQYCADWGNTIGVDNKHADCNGDGIVNGNDTMAIYANYGLQHNKGVHVPQAKSSAFPDLYFDFGGIALGAGGTVTIPIKLGTSALPMNDVYGIAAQVKISGISLADPMIVSSNASWMGNNSNSMDFRKSVSNEQTDWAFVRTDHSNVSGDGTIGSLTLTVPTGTEYQYVDMYFENVKIINKDGVEITDYNVIDANAQVYPLNVNTTQLVNSIAIVPNPSDAQAELQISLAAAANVQVIVTDITGRNIWSAEHSAIAGSQSIALPAAQLAPGMYTIQVRDEKGGVSKSLKWIKK